MAPGRVEHGAGAGRDERVGEDLAVRVVQAHPDVLAEVLEAVHLLDVGQRGELGGAVRPGLHHGLGLRERERGERGVVVGGEADHLAPAARVVQRRKPVLEHRDLVVGRGDLGGPAGLGRAERAVVGGRQQRAVLPVAGDGHPLVGERVVPQLAGRREVGQVTGVGRGAVGVLPAVVVDQLPTVGEPDMGAFDHEIPPTHSTLSNRFEHTRSGLRRAER